MLKPTYSYKNKVAVVTGASRGIGKAVVAELAGKGCLVVAIARPSDEFDQTVNTLINQNLNVRQYHCDLADSNEINNLTEKLINDFQRIDILVNSAGVGKFGPLIDLSDDEIRDPINVPMLAAISLSHRLLPAMINHSDSRIINLITPAAYFDLPYMAAYTASRSGLLSFTRALDQEVSQKGVRVHSVCPAWVDTQYLANNQTNGDWYPKVSKYFPTISVQQAAKYVIQSIEGNKRELKPSFLLKVFELSYRWFPRLSIATFKVLGLYDPPVLISKNRNRQDSENWTNWEESISLNPSTSVFPEAVEQVVEVIKDTDKYPSPVRAAGSRHTTTHCGVADQGTLMVMRKMDNVIHIDRESLTVTVEAGALYIDVAKALRKDGLQFYVNVEIGNLTMGSAASTGTKDASMPGEYGQVCSYCIGVKMVMSDGEVQTINEDQSDLLSAVRSSYGLLGVIVETTFKVKPILAMSVRHHSYTLDDFEQALPQLRQNGESMMYYLFPFQNKLTVEFRKYDEKNTTGINSWIWSVRNLFWKTIAPRWGYWSTRFVTNKSLRYFLIDNFYRLIDLVVCNVLKSGATVASDQIIRYPEHKNQSKYTFSIWAFPEDEIMPIMRGYYTFCQNYYEDYGFRCDMLNVGYRIKSDQMPLFSYSHSGTVMTLDPVTTGAPGWDDFLKAYNDFCSDHGGVPLFNQSKWLTRKQVQKAFDKRIAKFWKYRTQLDSNDRFLNDYFRELFEPR